MPLQLLIIMQIFLNRNDLLKERRKFCSQVLTKVEIIYYGKGKSESLSRDAFYLFNTSGKLPDVGCWFLYVYFKFINNNP